MSLFEILGGISPALARGRTSCWGREQPLLICTIGYDHWNKPWPLPPWSNRYRNCTLWKIKENRIVDPAGALDLKIICRPLLIGNDSEQGDQRISKFEQGSRRIAWISNRFWNWAAPIAFCQSRLFSCSQCAIENPRLMISSGCIWSGVRIFPEIVLVVCDIPDINTAESIMFQPQIVAKGVSPQIQKLSCYLTTG